MDAVPYNFVEDVAMLAGCTCLWQLQNLADPLWESVGQLHYRKREYFSVYFRQTERGIEHLFGTADDFITPEYVKKNRRFVRLNYVFEDILNDHDRRQWANAVVLSLSSRRSHRVSFWVSTQRFFPFFATICASLLSDWPIAERPPKFFSATKLNTRRF
ncbi:hypothetical protein QR680_014063 [Steinernema hermaphroditum]|uniref:Uncharacterized protein n=1 Tax=Steinernema hermaphroditum TaxID=289476 RepID=A0AA39I7L5_9BILA|nr:hypothetical protein QR680_014063 [Steinernema hermaphroditum]